MPHSVNVAMSESQAAFHNLVVPPLLNLFGGGTVLPVEGAVGELEQKLDREAGIDSVMFSERGVYGIASRVQFDENYRSFTVRKKRRSGKQTEWEKLLQAKLSGAMTPSLTVQAYIDRTNMRLLDAAVICTPDLVRWIENNPCKTRTTGWDQHGQADFWVVPWAKLRNNKSVRFTDLHSA